VDHLQDPAIVGREAELAALAAFLDRLPSGPAFLLLEGEAGIGKTTLWEAGVRGAHGRDWLVLSARPSETEIGFAYAALGDLLAPVPDVLSGLPPPQQEALGAALVRTGSPGRVSDHRAVSVGFLAVLRRLSQQRPTLVALEDVQWLDRASARAVEFALRRLTVEPVGLLGSLRSAAPSLGPPPLGLDRPPASRRLDRIAVGPLGPGAISQLLRSLPEANFSRRTVRRIHEASGGNPLHASELARAMARAPEPAPGEPLPVPATLEALLQARLLALPRATRRALVVAALLADPTLDALVAALGSADQVEAAVARAVRAGVLRREEGRVRFTHPLFASVAARAVQPLERRALHRLLAGVAAEPEAAARHLALGAEGPDETIAAAIEAAARDTRLRGALDAAAELFELARALTPPDLATAALHRTIEAGATHGAVGNRDRARDLLGEALVVAPPGTERWRVLRLLGELEATGESFPRARDLLVRALAEAGTDPRLRAPVELDLAYVDASSTADAGAGRSHARLAVRLAEATGDRSLLARAISVTVVLDFLAGDGFDEAASRRAIDLDDAGPARPIALDPTCNHGFILVLAGRLLEGDAVLQASVHQLTERGEEAELAFPRFFLVFATCVRGMLGVASRLADEALRDAELLGEPWSVGITTFGRALVRAHSGPLDAALDDLRAAEQVFQRMGWLAGIGWAAWLTGFVRLASGDPKAALSTLAPLAAAAPTGALSAVPGAICDAVEALVETRELESARRVADQLLRQSERGSPWVPAARARSLGLVEAAAGSAAGYALLAEAVDRLEAAGRWFDVARTLLARGRLERRDRRRRAARSSLERAAALFTEMGAAPWVRLTEAELARLGGRAPTPNTLTESERRVAELAAAGRTNRQIAEELVVSVRTVESHLAAIYRKLGIERRAELPTRLRGAGRQHPGPPPASPGVSIPATPVITTSETPPTCRSGRSWRGYCRGSNHRPRTSR
jgi:DNA-binding NarL/FixJ family response regulator